LKITETVFAVARHESNLRAFRANRSQRPFIPVESERE
jgi:hypothetical protein